jgi:hypothetical protein
MAWRGGLSEPRPALGCLAKPAPRSQPWPMSAAGSGETSNAHAVICLTEGNPADALRALRNVLNRFVPDDTPHDVPGMKNTGAEC